MVPCTARYRACGCPARIPSPFRLRWRYSSREPDLSSARPRRHRPYIVLLRLVVFEGVAGQPFFFRVEKVGRSPASFNILSWSSQVPSLLVPCRMLCDVTCLFLDASGVFGKSSYREGASIDGVLLWWSIIRVSRETAVCV